MWGIAPSEFWRMTPKEWWLVYDGRRTPEEESQPSYHELYELIWTGEDTPSLMH